ncbi:MAG TPA: potassium-transporting ATPase subunit KdpC [Bryobacteraceae bacterium]|nr:potassium-transporting ATPase subunit KdpC [Bryobacteraceae bacterium]
MKHLIIGLKVTLVLTLLTGVAYPLLVTALSHALFRRQADGSFVQANGRTVGSSLIGQRFTRPEYFHGRPSAAGSGYDALASGGTNDGPTSRKLVDRVHNSIQQFRAANPSFRGPVPADLVTSSASGLDPHLSPAAAEAQAGRVAAARGVIPAQIRALVERRIEGRQFGILGEPRVNVLELNLALDRDFPMRK